MRSMTVDGGQCLFDIALQEYGTIEAVRTICKDNQLRPDSDLFAGQQLLIREVGVDDIPFRDQTVLEAYAKKAKSPDEPYEVNSQVPGANAPPVIITELPSFYGAGIAGLTDPGIQLLVSFYAQSRQANNLPFIANMQRLWYVYPAAFGDLTSAVQTGGYEAISVFERLAITLTINGNAENYLAYRLKHDTYLDAQDNLTITFK